ncbi:carboxymuconolactone decarboxylase family protein [Lutibacter flavus]|uniref:Alkylhydroperoxidase AhpD family core domain-containing protein n=1 Tax=Lutibacter flavus TaxID=691689 RepID=A0A238XLD6_9FLAO|nr:carboxymuconolactone decarboxylase family protein [Lutibacter flavus]SNR59401.1 alkylhydroperoxidase AhpD family core domain-containing protein [Lutibacter flavus]
MIRDYCKYYSDLKRGLDELEEAIPTTVSGYQNLQQTSLTDGTLTLKSKELIALGIAISMGSTGCIALHVNDALIAGANTSEILETIEVAIFMGGEASVIYGCEALEALNQFMVLEK